MQKNIYIRICIYKRTMENKTKTSYTLKVIPAVTIFCDLCRIVCQHHFYVRECRKYTRIDVDQNLNDGLGYHDPYVVLLNQPYVFFYQFSLLVLIANIFALQSTR